MVLILCFHTHQVLLSNTTSFFFCTQLNGFKCFCAILTASVIYLHKVKWSNSCIWPTDGVAYWPLTEPSIRVFSEQDAPLWISGSSQMVDQKSRASWNEICRYTCKGPCQLVWKWVESVPPCSHEERPLVQRPTTTSFEYPRPRSDRSALSGFKDNTAWYGQVKKLWVNIVSLPLSVYFSHYRNFGPFRKNKKELSYRIVVLPSSRNTTMGLCQVLPLRVRVDLGIMVLHEYSESPKAS